MKKGGQYKKGARREYATMRALEAQGYLTLRAAGSHGPFDVIALRPDHGRCIQVKAGAPATITAVEEERLKELALEVPPAMAVELWMYDDRKRDPKVVVFPR